MWFLVVFTLLNAALKQYSVVNEHRISFGVVQIGVIEGLLLFGLLMTILRAGPRRALGDAEALVEVPTQSSPIFSWTMILLIVGLAFGVFGAFMSHVDLKDTLTDARDFSAIPLCLFMGYALIGPLTSGKKYAAWSCVAGCVTAFMLLLGFGQKSEEATLMNNLNPLRGTAVELQGEYAPVGALILIFTLGIGIRVMKWRPLALGMAAFCFVGYISTLSRTGTLIMGSGLLGCFFILPKQHRVQTVVKGLLVGVVIAICVIAFLSIADAAIGRGFMGKLGKHFAAMIPQSDEESSGPKAYDARFAAMQEEAAIWLTNPLMGRGFGIQATMMQHGEIGNAGDAYNHNGVTSVLAHTGIVGFAGCYLVFGSLIVVGKKMIRDAQDEGEIIIGALGFFCGICFVVRAMATMTFTTRAAVEFAMVCGVLLRSRELQKARRAALAAYEYGDAGHASAHAAEPTLLGPQHGEFGVPVAPPWQGSHHGLGHS